MGRFDCICYLYNEKTKQNVMLLEQSILVELTINF
jgi:hypothetical protein